jgi:LysR family transcriptional activator of glutamate synthase operon
LELRQLQYFIKVARKQHVTQAAEELHVAQSAVSRQIHQLEGQLGVQLFVQKGRNLQLTPVGKLFLSRVEDVISDLERAVNEVREFMDPEAGEIRLAFPHSLGVNLVPTMVAEFRKDHPNVKFRFKQGKYNSLIDMVMKGEVDLALISPFPENHDHVVGEVVYTEELFAILPPSHLLSEYESLRLEQLKDEAFVLFSEGYSLRTIVRDACMKSGFHPKVSFEGEETDTIRGLVAAGMGVSLLPEMALRYICSPLQPVKVRVREPKVTRTIGLIRRKDEKLPLVADVFRTFIIDYFQHIDTK